MGYISTVNGRKRWMPGSPQPRIPRLDELGMSGVFLDISIAGHTDDDGKTPVVINYIEHAASGFSRDLNMPGYIYCMDDEFYYLDEIFTGIDSSLTTYTETPDDGEIITHWSLMAGETSLQEYLSGCVLKTAGPIRAFTYEEIYPNWRE